jgi:hypothetical protein
MVFLHHIDESIEKVGGIMGAWGGLRMVLDREKWGLLMNESFQGIVIEIYVAELNVRVFQRFHVHTEPVVLGSNLDLARCQVLDRLIGSAVPKFEFKGFPT